MEDKTIIWTKLTELSPDNVNLIGNKIEGAYRLSYKDESDGNYYVFYVGDALDIKNVLLSHLRDKNTCIALRVKNYKCAFRYAIVSEEEIRKSTTKQAYIHYQPSCNESEPEGGNVNIQVNLS